MLRLAFFFSFLLASYTTYSNTDDSVTLNKTVVTGSMILLRESDLSSPVSVYTRSDIETSGALTANGLLRNLEFNTGAEINSDPFTQSSSAGTSQINLRGLGLASTLTLLNGRRTTLSGAYSIDGANFVDINTIPLIAIDRIEILKDGASAIYGSDAIAGVVNFKTRKNFDGYELSLGHQNTTRDNQTDTDLSGVWGRSNEDYSLFLALGYFDRTPLKTVDRDYTIGTGMSNLGSPGAFIPLGASTNPTYAAIQTAGANAGLLATTPIIDLGCEAAGGINAATAPFGTCDFDYLSYSYLMADETRLQSVGTFDYKINNQSKIYTELWLASSRSKFATAPSFANLTFPIVPADNPGNLASNDGLGVAAVYLGRPLVGDAAAKIHERNSDTHRFLFGYENKISNNWHWDSGYQYSQNTFEFIGWDTLIDRFNAALNGTGGPNNDEYFNPFSSAYLDPNLANSDSVINDFLVNTFHEVTTELHTLDTGLTGVLSNTSYGDISTAFGLQIRQESNKQITTEDSQNLNYAFVSGTQASSGERDVYSIYSEFNIPAPKDIQLQLAARYEHYPDTSDDTLNPKLGAVWQLNNHWKLRASTSTAFRAPSLQQQANSTVAVEQIGSDFAPVITQPNFDLKPETALIRNTGFEYKNNNQLSLSLDYWYFNYEDIIIQESAEAIFANDPNDDRIERDPNTGKITGVDVRFINASSVLNTGLDFSIKKVWQTGLGIFLTSFNSSWIESYRLQETNDGPTIDAVGSRNGLNIARSLPELRANLNTSWTRNQHNLTLITRYISNYKDDGNNDASISESYNFDCIYGYKYISRTAMEAEFSIGVINIFDQDPPQVETILGYDSKIHDPRGRLLTAEISIKY